MADIDDRWYRLDKATGTRVPTDRHGTGMRWLARWRDGEQQRRKSFSKRSDAEKFLAQVTADLSRGVYRDVRAGRVTVKQYGERWRSEQRHRDTTPEQVHALAAALPQRYQAIPYVAASTGLRGGEIFGLELPDTVDFLRREVIVRQQLKVLTARNTYLGPPKTKTSKRTVELAEAAALPVARHLELFPAVEVEVDDETDPRKPVRRMARLVFTNEWGQPIHRASWSHVWALAVRKVDLPAGFGLHGLRDFFATSLIHAGASVKTVQLALGHSTPMITLNTYVGEWPEAVDRTRTIIDGTLGVPRMCPEKRAAR